MPKSTIPMVTVVKVTRPETTQAACYYELNLFNAADEFAGEELGTTLLLELAEMPREDFENLPMFEGW